MNILVDSQQASSIYGISYDVIFTTIVTLSIFVLGYILNRIYEINKRKHDLKDIRSFLLVYLDSLIDPINKQISAFNDLSASVASKTHQDFTFQEAVGSKLDILDKLPQVDVFNAYLLGPKKTKSDRVIHFNSTHDALEFVKRQREIARAQFLGFMSNVKRYIEAWNNSTNAILRSYDEFLSFAERSRVSPSRDVFLKQFNVLVHNWTQLESRTTMENVAKHLLEPLKELCKSKSPDPRVNIVLPLVIDSLQTFKNRDHLFTLFVDYFAEQATKLEKKRNALTASIKCLEESQ